MNVSIIIPAYKPYNLLENCINSIIRNTNLNDIEIIVVCNGSDRESAELILNYGKNIRLVWYNESLGFTKAINKGLLLSEGHNIILMNTDCEILDFKEKNYWINKLLEPLKNNKIGITGLDFMSIGNVLFFPFYFVAFRKELIDEIGLLDESFSPGYCEDVDFCIRVINKNYILYSITTGISDDINKRYISDYPLWHKGEGSFKNSSERQKILNTNFEYLKNKWKNLF